MARDDPSAPGVGVRYVEVLPPTGWQRMANSVREIDEDKVHDCKEDIDTLLVFAGLYSAVLSAFNIESYTALQPNPNDQMIGLLERIAVQTQSYTITSSSINSTAQPSSPPPLFVAPIWALRVNGLWFASLIISLAAASLSMLVKQWLREFVAVQYRTPQQRLRAHQYRKAGLDKWKVFEIAAVLPMLLQISLGLFFIGLCVFTSQVDERMGLTSIPLVSGWAFFLIATTLAPLISPRCPYKMPLLKSIMQLIRTHLTMKIRSLLNALVTGDTVKARSMLGHELLVEATEEEDKVVSAEQDDKDLLLAIDILMSDDTLIPTMWDALKQRLDPAQSLSFVVELLISRGGPDTMDLRQERLRSIPDLSFLPYRTWEMFIDIIVELASRGHPAGPLRASSPDWLYKTALLLMSTSPYHLSAPAAHYLHELIADSSEISDTLALAKWVHPRTGEEPFVFRPIAKRLGPLYGRGTDDKQEYVLPILYLYVELLQFNPQEVPDDPRRLLFPLLVQTPELFHDQHAMPILQDIGIFLCDIFRWSLKSRIYGTEEAFAVMVTYPEQLGVWSEVSSILAATWSARSWSYRALVHLTRIEQHPKESRESRARILELAVEAFAESNDQAQIIRHSTEDASGLQTDQFKRFRSVIDAVRFCALHIRLYIRFIKDKQQLPPLQQKSDYIPPAQAPDSDQWAKLWEAISGALRTYWRLEKWKTTKYDPWWSTLTPIGPDDVLKEDRWLAGECLTLIGSIEADENYAMSRSPHQNTHFPDNIVKSLGLFITPDDIADYPCLQRLQEEREKEEGDVPSPSWPTADAVDPGSDSSSASSIDDTLRRALRNPALKTSVRSVAKGLGINTDRKIKTQRTRTARGKKPMNPASEDHAEDADADSDASSTHSIDDNLRSALRDRTSKMAVQQAVAQSKKGEGSSEGAGRAHGGPRVKKTIEVTDSDGELGCRPQ
ncbi:hypothetical protein PsYK624_066890 [Phanerochaete sordida]|uniref:DUF6535 domain-containing protein n=1 Tax=Phanerochaete sordida TaxID=48140 RepID=A0A9P3G927_9APHY|nr:hypothetical protein PsYK624_066890 [Phanerochaete sordida]